MIDKATIDKIYLSANIIDIVGDFVSLKKKGVNYQACCPFHDEKTPSFVVSQAKGIYKCFGCGKAGNSVTFLMDHESLSYTEALKYIARRYGIEVKESQQTEESKQLNSDRDSMLTLSSYANNYFINQLNNSSEGRNIGLSYFQERGFTKQTIEKFQLGYCPSSGDSFSKKAIEDGYKEEFLVKTGLTIIRETGGYYDRFSSRVLFPIHSLSGNVIGFGGRILSQDKKKAKYLNSPESEIYHKSHTLYGIFYAKKSIVQENKCILVEGYTDVISMMQLGIENIVASSGTSLTQEQIKLIARFTKNITVIYDGDSAGIKASLRGIDMILAQGLNVRVVSLPESEDPDSFARTHTLVETKKYIDTNEEDFISFKTKLLISDVKDDPMGKAEVITEIVNTIAVIPDEILRSQYAKQCSKILDQDENLILRSISRKHAYLTNGNEGVSYYDNTIRKDSFVQKQSKIEKIIKKSDKIDINELEKELITYLLKYGKRNINIEDIYGKSFEVNISNEIIEELKSDEIYFQNKVYQEIFNDYIVKSQHSNEDTVIIDSFINHQNPEICRFVINIISQEEIYRPSKIWQKLDRMQYETDTLDIAIPKTLALYKLKIIELIKNEALKDLANDKDNLEILKHINNLNIERKKTCEKYSRIF